MQIRIISFCLGALVLCGGPALSDEARSKRLQLRLTAMLHNEEVAAFNELRARYPEQRIDLSGQDLSNKVLPGVNLSELNLERSKFVGARMQAANLQASEIYGADFSGADLTDANVSHVFVDGSTNQNEFTKFRDTDFEGATIQSSTFNQCDFTGAVFYRSLLQATEFEASLLDNARFGSANMSGGGILRSSIAGTDFFQSDVSGLQFDPTPDTIAKARGLSEAQGLKTLRPAGDRDPGALIQLKYVLRAQGATRAALAVHVALKNFEREKLAENPDAIDWATRAAHWFYYFPVEYGGNPLRALWLLLWIILGFAPLYAVALLKPGTRHGIWKVDSENPRVPEDQRPIQLMWPHQQGARERFKAVGFFLCKLIGLSLAFSLLTSTSYNLSTLGRGSVLLSLWPRPEALVALGWTRTVSAAQHLLSFYIWALFAASFFQLLPVY